MKQSVTIQKKIAIFLLIIFSISMAPRTYFHTLFANHTDVSFCNEVHKASFCLHKQGINCHFDDLVVTAPFVFESSAAIAEPPVVLAEYQQKAIPFFFYSIIHAKEGRGPPCV